MQKIFCVSYVRIHVLISLTIVKMKFWTVIVTSLHKQLRPSAIVLSSDSQTSTEEEESSDPESFDDKTSD